jgi:hypothetical protein
MSDIKTPWGSISSKVSLFPIYYLLFIYGFVYILPFGKNFMGTTWFDLLKKEDGPLEWLQFAQLFISSLMGFFIFYKSKKKKSINSLIWLLFSIFCFLVSAEEISWGERITGFTLNSISDLSIQGETNFHNLPFFHNVLLDPLLHVICLFLGWVGWKKWPNLTSLPSRKYSLYFLLVSLFFAYYDLSWASTVQHIRNDQEIFEFLLSTGIFLHFFEEFKSLKNLKK